MHVDILLFGRRHFYTFARSGEDSPRIGGDFERKSTQAVREKRSEEMALAKGNNKPYVMGFFIRCANSVEDATCFMSEVDGKLQGLKIARLITCSDMEDYCAECSEMERAQPFQLGDGTFFVVLQFPRPRIIQAVERALADYLGFVEIVDDLTSVSDICGS